MVIGKICVHLIVDRSETNHKCGCGRINSMVAERSLASCGHSFVLFIFYVSCPADKQTDES